MEFLQATLAMPAGVTKAFQKSALLALCLVVLSSCVDAEELVSSSRANQSGSCLTTCTCPPRTGDQVWLVSTRHLCCSCCQWKPPQLKISRLDSKSGWQPSSVEKFFDNDDPNVLTCFYIHGARVKHSVAVQRAIRLHRALTCGIAEDYRVRFVIWSWPTTPHGRLFHDFHQMIARSVCESKNVAWFVSQMNPRVKTSFVGFSLGCRVTSGTMHILAGGRLCNCPSSNIQIPAREKSSVVFWSAAMHNYWLMPGCYHGKSLESMDRLLNLYNSCDSSLRHYKILIKGASPEALGYTGIAGIQKMGDAQAKIEQRDICRPVGRRHGFDYHMRSGFVISQTRQAVFANHPLLRVEQLPQPVLTQ